MKNFNSKEALAKIKELQAAGAIAIEKARNSEGKDSYTIKPTRAADGKIIYPTETSRQTTEALLGQSYLITNEAGDYLPNYDVILENFTETDNSIDLEQFTDSRTGKRNSKITWQTDSIVSSKNKETNSTADDEGSNAKTRGKALREVSLIITEEYGTETTEINLRDVDSDIVAFDLLASDMEQHNRMNKLQRNRFILGKMIEGSRIVDTGIIFNEAATDMDAEYIKLGKAIYPVIKNEIQNFKEVMTIYRPGGFAKSDLFVLSSPKAARACVDYQTSLPSSDKAFTAAAEGELYNFAIDQVKVYETNLLKGGQTLEVLNADGITQIEFQNNDNVEVIIGVNNYMKYAKATPFINSSPMIINRQEVPHIIGQYTENMHNGIMIIDQLFIGISFERVDTEDDEAIVSNLTTTNPSTIGGIDGSVNFDIAINYEGPEELKIVAQGAVDTNEVIYTGNGNYTIDTLSADNYVLNITADGLALFSNIAVFELVDPALTQADIDKAVAEKDAEIARLMAELEAKNKDEDK